MINDSCWLFAIHWEHNLLVLVHIKYRTCITCIMCGYSWQENMGVGGWGVGVGGGSGYLGHL